jgi:hypothetical protein
MRSNHPRGTRRAFLVRNTTLAASFALGAPRLDLGAASENPLSESAPAAVALGYRHDGSTSGRPDVAQRCAACNQFRAGADTGWGKCLILSAGLVNANGWCRAFTRKS